MRVELALPAFLGALAAFLVVTVLLDVAERRRQRRLVFDVLAGARSELTTSGVAREIAPSHAIALVLAGLAGLTLGWFLAGWLGALAAALFGVVLASRIVERERRGAAERAREQLPRSIQVIASSLLAGATIYQAIRRAAEETAAPLGIHLRRMVERFGVNMTAQEAFDALRQELPGPSTATVLVVLEIQRTIGGNLASLLTDLAAALQSQESLRRDAQVLTAQARYSAVIIGSLPWVVLLVFLLFFRDYVAPLFEQEFGRLLLGVALAGALVGFFFVRRIASAVEQAV